MACGRIYRGDEGYCKSAVVNANEPSNAWLSPESNENLYRNTSPMDQWMQMRAARYRAFPGYLGS
jgi:hypothetical protein